MPRVELADLLNAGAHFGHLTRRWNPRMKPFIFMERNGIHIIDLKKTQELLEFACNAISGLAAEGRRVLFVGTKKQAKMIIEEEARRCGQFYVSERWLGGMLTNFSTIRKSVKRLTNIEKMETDGTYDKLTKKETLVLDREKSLLDGAVLPWAAACAEARGDAPCAERARACFARLPRPGRYGALAFLEANLREGSGALPLDARSQQGLLALYKTECTQGGCGRCPLS